MKASTRVAAEKGMKPALRRQWKVILPVVCLGLFVAAEKAGLVRTDSMATVACAGELLRARPEPEAIISRYRQAIGAEAARRDLPPEILATIIHSHQQQLTSFRSFTDCAGSAMGSDLSLGLGQIRISTAAGNDAVRDRELPIATFRKYRSMLLDPVQNIRFLGTEVRLLLDRPNRSPGISDSGLIHDPAAMVLLLSEYRMGRQAADKGTARIGASAMWDLGYMEKSDVYVFGRDVADAALIRTEVRKHLDHLYCDKGIFNSDVCERRRQ
jgi:hypothetical protein